MKVVNVAEQAIQGPRSSMHDVTAMATAADGAEYFGIFDGHSKMGFEVASAASEVIRQVAGMEFEPHHDAVVRANRIKEALTQIGLELDTPDLRKSGSTATVGILKDDRLAVAYLGDSEAFFYPDDGKAISLIHPHTIRNEKEVRRVEGLDYEIFDDAFDGYIQISRSVGDFNLKFISRDAEIEDFTLPSAGTLVIASDGVWGKNHDDVERIVRSMPRSPEHLAIELVNGFATRNQDNASAVVARIE